MIGKIITAILEYLMANYDISKISINFRKKG